MIIQMVKLILVGLNHTGGARNTSASVVTKTVNATSGLPLLQAMLAPQQPLPTSSRTTLFLPSEFPLPL